MIRITLQITDPETAEAYRGLSPEAIAADLLHDWVMGACEVVSVEDGDDATPPHRLAKDWERKAVALNDEALKSPKHRERFFTMAGVFRACAARIRQAMMEQKQSKP